MKKISDLWVIVGTSLFVLIVIVGISIYLFNNIDPDTDPDPIPPTASSLTDGVGRFASEEEFYSYIAWTRSNSGSGAPNVDWGWGVDEMITNDGETRDLPDGVGGGIEPQLPSQAPEVYEDRYSGTNTQVLMVDEADKVKTDGTYIYYFSESYGFYDDTPVFDGPTDDIPTTPTASEGNDGISLKEDELVPSIAPPQNTKLTKVIEALPPAEASVVAEINEGEDMYLYEDMLIFMQYDGIASYDVTDPTNPVKDWTLSFSDEGSLNTSRLYEGSLYVVLDQYIFESNPCPIPLIMRNGIEISMPCTDIYRPNDNTYVDSLITVLRVDPLTGEIEKKLGFVGNSYTSKTYMSGENLYVTYQKQIDEYELVSDFVNKNQTLFTQPILDKIEQLDSYDISSSSKMSEVNNVLDQYSLFLNTDEKSKFRNDINNAFDTYIKTEVRSFTSTGIVRIDTKELQIAASGSFPGVLLNQFSMDEYEGHLRVATTVSGSTWGNWFRATIEQQNDVIVMDGSLDTVGSVLGLGLTESVYSARFIGNMGYVVTFRQIDPFYVIDLSDPRNPQMKGELKIPGYSSYLHPISDEIIMGVGQENNRVKISLFDISNPSNPIEVSKYALVDYWSEVESNHHAFLNDPDHQVVFIPGSEGGYIFSYEDDELRLERTITGYTVDRAAYIDDYMYIFSAEKMVVLDENSWEIVKELDL